MLPATPDSFADGMSPYKKLAKLDWSLATLVFAVE
jgi:hypothetical protein